MQFELNAQVRNEQGTGASRRLRRGQGSGHRLRWYRALPRSIELDHNTILLNLRKEAFHAPS
jgi:large subunit ribosomal protein L25